MKNKIKTLNEETIVSILTYIIAIVAFGVIIFISGCKSKIVYIPVESVKIEKDSVTIRDTIVNVELIPFYDSNVTDKDSSYLENDYAFSNAYWDGQFLHHDLGIKNKRIPVKVLYLDRWHIRIDSIPYLVEVPIKGDTIYEMKWYEEIFFYIGLLAVIILGLYGGFKFIKPKLF